MDYSSLKCCWDSLGVDSGRQPTTESAGCHSVAGTETIVDSGCDSIDKMVPGTSAESLVASWNAGGCCL